MVLFDRFMPNFMRLASWNICMFVAFEQLKRGLMRMPSFRPPEPDVTSAEAEQELPVIVKTTPGGVAERQDES